MPKHTHIPIESKLTVFHIYQIYYRQVHVYVHGQGTQLYYNIMFMFFFSLNFKDIVLFEV